MIVSTVSTSFSQLRDEGTHVDVSSLSPSSAFSFSFSGDSVAVSARDLRRLLGSGVFSGADFGGLPIDLRFFVCGCGFSGRPPKIRKYSSTISFAPSL